MKQLWTTCKYVSQSQFLLIHPISISNRRTQLESISTRKFAQKTSETLHQTRELIAIEALLLHHHQHVLYLCCNNNNNNNCDSAQVEGELQFIGHGRTSCQITAKQSHRDCGRKVLING